MNHHSIRITNLEIATENTTLEITPGKTIATKRNLPHPNNPLAAGSLIEIQGILIEQHPQQTDQGVLITPQFLIIGMFGSQQLQLPPDAFIAPSSLVIA